MTAILQMLVVLACAFGFAAYVLKRDKKEHLSSSAGKEDKQTSIYFPEQVHGEENQRRGAAMTRLTR